MSQLLQWSLSDCECNVFVALVRVFCMCLLLHTHTHTHTSKFIWLLQCSFFTECIFDQVRSQDFLEGGGGGWGCIPREPGPNNYCSNDRPCGFQRHKGFRGFGGMLLLKIWGPQTAGYADWKYQSYHHHVILYHFKYFTIPSGGPFRLPGRGGGGGGADPRWNQPRINHKANLSYSLSQNSLNILTRNKASHVPPVSVML